MGQKLGFVFVACALFLAAFGGTNDVCNLDKESGDCGSYMPRYYFNKDTRKCERFVYTGCKGNNNNFGYEWECERTCPGDLNLGNICNLAPESGMCMAYFRRYFFNNTTRQCEEFVFGGCGGNHNNFRSVEECQTYCPPVPQPAFDRKDCEKDPEEGPCEAFVPRYYYDKATNICKNFLYTGCGGNRNNFQTEDDCYSKCGENSA